MLLQQQRVRASFVISDKLTLLMVRSLGFGSVVSHYKRFLKLAFATPPFFIKELKQAR